MRRCADASFLIDVTRSDLGAVEVLRDIQLAGEPLLSPAPAVAELLLGAFLHKGKAMEQAVAFAEALESIPTDYLVAAEAAQIGAELYRKGRPLPMVDLLIAATARAGKLSLITRDKAFDQIAGLSVTPY